MSLWNRRVALLGFLLACAPQQSDPTLADAAAADVEVPVADVAPDVAPAADLPSLCRAATPNPQWYQRAIGYEVFVRSFQDSDGDGIGDFKGLTSRLDYLNDGKPGGSDLGIDLLWLMPVNASPSDHGYDVTDYRALNPQYGTDADFDALVAAAHARGIRVVLDLVLNHSSNQHAWFQASAAGTAKADWYLWSPVAMDWKQPFGNSPSWHADGKRWYYGVFSSSMPDLNYTNPAVTAEMTDVSLAWLDRGVDGYRLDAVRYLVETGPGAGQKDTAPNLAWWQTWAAQLRQHQLAAGKIEPLMVGEAWAANAVAAQYQAPGGLNMTFDFDLASALLTSLQTADSQMLAQVLCAEDTLFAPGATRGTFLTNHDMVRIATQLASPAANRLAAVLLFALPGTPWVYYGEEIGLHNGDGTADEAKRQPMQWQPGAGVGFTTGTPWQAPNADADTVSVQAQTGQPGSLLALYRQLIALRQATDALAVGETRLLGSGASLGILRQSATQRVLVGLNLGDAALTPGWTTAQLGAYTQATDLLTGQVVGPTLPDLPAHGFWLLQLQ